VADVTTKPTPANVAAFIDAVENPVRRADAQTVCALLERVTGESPRMWGASIIGFGSYHYRYDSGHEGDMCRLGFSPRKAQLVLYVLSDTPGETEKLARLGKHKTGKSCLYINKLSDVDMAVLEEIARDALADMNARYPPA
jgi:hypothetical protein